MKRDGFVNFRVSRKEKRTLQEAADRRGLTTGAFLRMLGLAAARHRVVNAPAIPQREAANDAA